jgi:tetratricopeptide (TPR) repeat protein
VARGEFEQARQQFTEAIRLRPDYLPARLALAQLEVMQSQFEQALKSADDILQVDKKNGPARMIQAAALMGERKYADARRLLEALRQANPNTPDVDFSLGMLAVRENNLKEAESVFRKAYAANPKDTRSLVGLVETLAGGGHLDQAIQFLQAELAKNPSRIDLQMTLGNIAARGKNYDLAIGQFQAVLNELDKNSKARGDVYFRMGIALREKGDLNGSIQFLSKAREAMPVNSTVGVELALGLAAAGRKQEAKEAYEQSIKLNPQDGVALNNLAFMIAESNSGDLDQALTYAQRAKQVLPNLTEVSDTLGWIYLKKNMSDNAMDVFQGLVNQKPDNPTYRFHLGMALAQKGDKPQALRELQRALRSNPGKDEETKIKDLISKL